MNTEDRQTHKCIVKGCVAQGIPLDGQDFFLCDRCREELDALLELARRERVRKLFARHRNN